jgi:hypothetical protein
VWARRARHDGARLGWMGVAVLALHALVMLVPGEVLNAYFRQGGTMSSLFQVGYLVVSLLAGLLCWVVVWRQMPLTVRVPVKQVWWRAPAVAAAVGLLYLAMSLVIILNHRERGMLSVSISWESILVQALQTLVFNWVVGVVALRLLPAPDVALAVNDAE